MLAADMPDVNVWNSALGSSIIATSPGYYVAGTQAIMDRIDSQVTAVIQGGGVKNAALVWAGCNDAGRAALDDAANNPELPGEDLIVGLDVDICTRLDNYLAALFTAGIMKIVVCTEPGAPLYFGGPGAPAQDAFDRVMAAFNAHVLALDDPRIIVADLASAELELAEDGLHYHDYAPHEAYLLSFCQLALT